MTPQRIQRKRERDWKAPVGTVNVTRPGKFGNPFRVVQWVAKSAIHSTEVWAVIIDDRVVLLSDYKEMAIKEAISQFELYLQRKIVGEPRFLEPLRGKNLMCFCSLNNPCHADILLYYANGEQS